MEEIGRTAKANGGDPLGRERFLTDTGIKQSDWYGKYWIRWGDACARLDSLRIAWLRHTRMSSSLRAWFRWCENLADFRSKATCASRAATILSSRVMGPFIALARRSSEC